jgi:hypothetical protein
MLILSAILLGAETEPTAELLRDAERNKVLLEFADRTPRENKRHGDCRSREKKVETGG